MVKKEKEEVKEPALINPLRNERVIVRFIAKKRGSVDDPRHFLYGGMAESSKRVFTVPLLRTGGYVNVLTNSEKEYLENILGLEKNALSVHKKENNYWDDSNKEGFGTVEVSKKDTFLNLADPLDYIKYKVLLANKDVIAPSLQAYQDMPRATYDFVLISENSASEEAKSKVSAKAKAYREFGKVEDNTDILRLVIELIEGRPVSKNTNINMLQAKIGDIIDSNAKLFIKTVTDPLLNTKVLIKNAVESGVIACRGNYYYYKESNLPLCEDGQEPTFNVAAAFLNHPKRQELKFSIEAKVKNNKE